MTAQRRVAVRRNATANPPQIAGEPLTGLRRRPGRPEAQEPAETQLAFVFPTPIPAQRTRPRLPEPPPMPPRPTKAIRARVERERDEVLAVCACPNECGLLFADYDCYRAHRRNGDCLTPADAGLTLLDRDYECYGTKEDR